MSFINLIGFIIILQLRDRQWFKKETWKMQKTNIMNENKIKLAKLEKELGLKGTKISSKTTGESNVIGETIGKAIQGYLGGEDSGSGLGGIVSGFLDENPEVVDSFFKGLSDGGANKNQLAPGLFSD